MNLQISIVVAFIIFFGFSCPCKAELTPAQAEQLIRNAKVLPESSKISVLMKDSEATVSTFLNSAATESDCKIDATLIAQALIDGHPSEIARVTVFFYYVGARDYLKIAVTAGDVKAYGAGTLSKELLLKSLQVERKTDNAQSPIVSSSRAVDTAKSPQNVSQSSTQRFSQRGITFNYPSTWSLHSTPDSITSIARLENSTYPHAYLEIKLEMSNKTVIEQARRDAQRHLKEHPGAQVVPHRESIKFGKNKYNATEEFITYMEQHGAKPRQYYYRSVYFGWPGSTYRVKLVAPREDYHKAFAAYQLVLDTTVVEAPR